MSEEQEYTVLDEEPKEDNLTFLYNVLFKPKGLFEKLNEDARLGLAFLVFLGVTILTALTGILFPVETELQELMQVATYSTTSLGLIAIGTSVFGMFWWFTMAAVMGLTAELLGGKGSIRALLAGFGFAQLPQLFMIPGTIIAYFFLPSVDVLFSLVIGLWVLYLYYRAIKDIYKLSTGKAIGTLVIPWIALLLVIIIVAIVFFVVFAESLMFLEDFYYMVP